jgi:hypothetical protein
MYSMIRKAFAAALFALAVSVIAPSTASATDYGSYLFSDDVLYCGDRVISSDGNWNLALFCGQYPNGQLVQDPLYANGCGAATLGYCWEDNAYPGDKAIMQLDGNFVKYLGSTPVWDTGTNGYWGSHLTVQNDSNIVVYTYTDVPIWSIW